MSKKKILAVAIISGILNFGNAYLVYQLFPPPTFSRGAGQFSQYSGQFSQYRGAGGAGSESMFYLTSFAVGFLLVLAIVGIALTYAHVKSPKAAEDEDKTEDELNIPEDEEEKTDEEPKIEKS